MQGVKVQRSFNRQWAEFKGHECKGEPGNTRLLLHIAFTSYRNVMGVNETLFVGGFNSSISPPLPLPLPQMVQSREHQLTQTENETKLDQVQQRFPNDNLFLSETLVAMEVRSSTFEITCKRVQRSKAVFTKFGSQ